MLKSVLSIILIVASIIELGAKYLFESRLINRGRRDAVADSDRKTLDMEKQAREIEATNNDPAAARDWLHDTAKSRTPRSFMLDDGPP